MDNPDSDKKFDVDKLTIVARFRLVKDSKGKTRLEKVEQEGGSSRKNDSQNSSSRG